MGKVLHAQVESIGFGVSGFTAFHSLACRWQRSRSLFARYSKFAAGEPPESIFEPPPGIVCQPSRRFSVTSAVDDVSVGTPLRTPVLSERAPHDDVASSGLVFANDPYLADMSHYEPDCRIDPMAPSGMVCSQRAAPSTALRVACVGDSITAVGHTSSKAHQYPSQLQDILDASYGNGASRRLRMNADCCCDRGKHACLRQKPSAWNSV